MVERDSNNSDLINQVWDTPEQKQTLSCHLPEWVIPRKPDQIQYTGE